MYTVLVLPWRIGFEQDATGVALIFDYWVDLCFFVDLVLCFRTGFFVHQEEIYISDPWKIGKKYLLTFFVPDFLSCIPLELLIEAISGGSGSAGRSFKLMKFVRLVRLMKLMRLAKLQRFMAAMEDYLDLNPLIIRMVKLMTKIVFLAHLLACMWHFIALPVCHEDQDNSLGPCGPAAEDPPVPNWIRTFGVDNLNLTSRYIASFHFVTATMMAVGYGDIFATNTVERVLTVFMQLSGATAFGFILSAVTTLLDAANPRDTEHKKRMAEIKEWLTCRQLPGSLRKAVKDHFCWALSKRSTFNEVEILSNVPTRLRSQIIHHSYTRKLGKVELFFPNEDLALHVDMALQLRAHQATAGEIILEGGEICQEVFFVSGGRVEALLMGPAVVDQLVPPGQGSASPSLASGVTEFWARRCLSWGTQRDLPGLPRGRPGTSAAEAPSTPAGATSAGFHEPESPSSLRQEYPQVYCGLFQTSECFGQFPACPFTVRCEQIRCEILTMNKDLLFYVLSRYPGAMGRYDLTEQEALLQILKVLGSADVRVEEQEEEDEEDEEGITWPTKELVLFQGWAVPHTNVPKDVNLARARAIFRHVPAGAGPWESPGKSSKHEDMDMFSGPGLNRQDSPPESPKKLGMSRPSLSRTMPSSPAALVGLQTLHTLRMNPSTKEIEDADESEADLIQRWIVPPYHRHKLKWDLWIGLIIVYSVLIIPYNIGFQVEIPTWRLVIDIFVDLFFAADMMATFRTAFINAEGLVNTIPMAIRKNYLAFWFVIDFFSTFPIDVIVEAIVASSSGGGSNAGTQTRALKLVRIVRLARLLKLARLAKMGKVVNILEEIMDLSPLVLKCLKLGGRLTVLAHLLGCFWYYVSVQPDPSTDSCQVGLLGCTPGQNGTTWWKSLEIQEEEKGEQYIAALYWAFTTMTTVGYGDIVPKSDAERVYAIVSMIFGATSFGYITGSIAALAGQERGYEAVTKKRICLVRDFCDEQSLSRRKQDQVKMHYQYVYQERTPYDEGAMLMELPQSLRKQVLLYIHREAIAKVGLFSGPSLTGLHGGPLPAWFVAWTMQMLEPQMICGGEDIIHEVDIHEANAQIREIFFVCDGECEAYVRAQKAKRNKEERGHSDTGGSGDDGKPSGSRSNAWAETTASSSTSSSTAKRGRNKILMVFTRGCMFGMQHLLPSGRRYLVRASPGMPCFLQVLRQAAIAEVAFTVPEMAIVLRSAVSSALIQQMKFAIPERNLEQRQKFVFGDSVSSIGSSATH